VGFLEEALAKALGAGSRSGQAFARLNLGCCLMDADRPSEACEHLETVVELARQLGMRIVEGCARGELGRAFLGSGALEVAESHLMSATSILAQVSRWHALRFSLHLAAVQASRGAVLEARRGFSALGSAPEIKNDPVLRELAALLAATLHLVEARAAAPGSPEAERSKAEVLRRLEHAQNVPQEGASSDLRGWLRLLEPKLRALG
jgi:hypothetical protein